MSRRGEGAGEGIVGAEYNKGGFGGRAVYPESRTWRLMEEMRLHVRATMKGLAAAAFLVAGVAAWGQAPPAAPADAQCADATKAAQNCPAQTAAPAAPKSAAQQFPFPGEEPSAADHPADVAPDAPSAPQAKTPRTPPPEYPGDPDAKDASSAPSGSSSSGSSSSSSSGSGYDAAGPGDDAGPLTDAGSSGDTTTPGHSRRRRLPKVAPETPESREAEDLTVAEFYSNDGNYAAAYLRAKDAVQYQPGDPNAHFALAQAAFKLGKRDEAKEHYTQVLQLDPIPKQLKATQKALAELGSAAH